MKKNYKKDDTTETLSVSAKNFQENLENSSIDKKSKTSKKNKKNEDELKESVKEILGSNIVKNNKKKIDERDCEILNSIVGEYLDSFILFGYSMDMNRILIANYKTPKDKDAIMEFLNRLFSQYQEESEYGE